MRIRNLVIPILALVLSTSAAPPATSQVEPLGKGAVSVPVAYIDAAGNVMLDFAVACGPATRSLVFEVQVDEAVKDYMVTAKQHSGIVHRCPQGTTWSSDDPYVAEDGLLFMHPANAGFVPGYATVLLTIQGFTCAAGQDYESVCLDNWTEPENAGNNWQPNYTIWITKYKVVKLLRK